MIKKYQVTIICPTGEYKPVACIINNEQNTDEDLSLNKTIRKELQKKGLIKICQKRFWTTSDLKKYNFTKYKIRAVD